MKKLTACLIAVALFCVLPLTLSAADAENVRIDYKMNVAQEAYSGNYFSWAVGKNEAVKDMFDAASGASTKGSTKAFNSIRYAEPAADKKAAMPTGLRGLFLYPVAAWDVAAFDNLQVSTNGGIITVRFVHRGNAYELMTDKKGNFDILTGAKIARKVGDNNMNVFTVKPEYLKDTFNPEAAYHYEGNLKFTFKNNILSISGIMKRK